ncbi:serine/threonine-protein kinase [Streptomyces sp. DH8]|uniref:serine/threonine-protein kinase n=1 Tax=Streptomyces sp. DH8 TaxID=2857008 RepID=UPI0035B3AE68
MEGIRPLAAGDPVRIGPYPLLGRLGAGGMGRVYLARSAGGRTVAVKVVHEEHIANGEFRARFRREIRSARRVGGRWTAPVLDADADAEQPWVATGYVPGPSLEQAVREHGPLPAASVHALAEGLLRALRGIHAAGIVHRDLKPSNVLLTVDGPRVIDFGIARAFQVSVESLLTSTGMVIGSPGFMAPEQILGEETGPAADVFSLGCVLMYAAAGQLPFGAGASNQHSVMFQIVQSSPDLTAVADAHLRALIERCLTKSAAERPSVEALLEELAASKAEAAPHGAWLPPVLLARLARQSALLLDAEVPGQGGESGSSGGSKGAVGVDPPEDRGTAVPVPVPVPVHEGEGVREGEAVPEAADVSGAEGPDRVPAASPPQPLAPALEAADPADPADPAASAPAPASGPAPAADAAPASASGPAPASAPGPAPVSAAAPAHRDLGTVDLRPAPVEAVESAAKPAPAAAEPPPASHGGRSRRRRVWIVAAVVVAVLAAGGTTAFLNRDPGGVGEARGGEAATPPGSGGASSGPAASPSEKGDDEDGAKDDGKDGPEDKGAEKGDKGEKGAKGEGSAGKGDDADGGGGGSASGGGGSGEGGSADAAGAGGDGGGQGGAGSSASSGSGDGAKPPASNPAPAPDGRVPQQFVGTWSIASQYDVLQPHTVVIRRVAPGRSAVTLVSDVQGSGHCEYTAKLSSVASGGTRINVGAGVVDTARSTGMCRDTDPSSFTLAGSGILHDVGPAHGSGYRYNRA